MKETRLNKWKDQRKAPAFMRPGEDREVQEIFQRRREERIREEGDERATILDFLTAAKELIFDIAEGQPTFYIVLPAFNTQRVEMEIAPLLQTLIEGDPEETKEQVKYYLALAFTADVPVYPNSEEVASELARYHRDLLIEGFKAPNESGEDVHLVLANSPGVEVGTLEHVKRIRTTDTHSPAELHLVREAMLTEIAKRDEAGRVLASLRLAIAELSSHLAKTERNENALQKCLTRNPILFGTEYTRIIPKHKLGDEYEMDYALERVSGLVDLVELEASTHTLFTKKGNPTQHLVHAEQQVLDWLDWIERHSSYARDRLPGLVQPVGYVVIGRSQSLSDKDQERLRRRNLTFRGVFQILTYDDLLDSARNLLRVLEGKVSD